MKQLPRTGSPETGSRQAALVAQVSLAMLRQERSQFTAQQYGSRWQTSWQQKASEQPGVAWIAKQLPDVGCPQAQFSVAQDGFTSASCVQLRSHEVSQQYASRPHTALQQVASLQYGDACTTQQSPVSGPPQVTHLAWAISTQAWSQPVLQHSGSRLQTVVQQVESAQYGSGWTARQSPVPGRPHDRHSWPASATQPSSQDVLQHDGSDWQTCVQHAGSVQAGVGWTSKQLAGFVPQLRQVSSAWFTQDVSQTSLQQEGSSWQTAPQQSASLHPLPSWGVKQSRMVPSGFSSPQPEVGAVHARLRANGVSLVGVAAFTPRVSVPAFRQR